MERLGNPAADLGARFTYRHYKTWPEDERWELIDGRAWDMCPAPSTRHQRPLGKLFIEVCATLKGRPCEAFIAPFAVLFPHRDEGDDVVATVA
jgi:hypothetical protein